MMDFTCHNFEDQTDQFANGLRLTSTREREGGVPISTLKIYLFYSIEIVRFTFTESRIKISIYEL